MLYKLSVLDFRTSSILALKFRNKSIFKINANTIKDYEVIQKGINVMKQITKHMRAEFQSDLFLFGCGMRKTAGNIDDVTFSQAFFISRRRT